MLQVTHRLYRAMEACQQLPGWPELSQANKERPEYVEYCALKEKFNELVNGSASQDLNQAKPSFSLLAGNESLNARSITILHDQLIHQRYCEMLSHTACREALEAILPLFGIDPPQFKYHQ